MISKPEIPSFCGLFGDLAPSTRKSPAIAIVRSWCAKGPVLLNKFQNNVGKEGGLIRGPDERFLSLFWQEKLKKAVAVSQGPLNGGGSTGGVS